jgi:glycosyltransferase involved in cell wall biosynthesis
MVEQNPLVSIIIPFYNRVEYLERSIKSVICQTYINWELIIVDDCSNEKFELTENCNGKITLLKNEINLGPGLSRQYGIEHSNGQFLCFLDSDDYYQDEFLAKAISEHLNNIEISATYCTSIYSDGKIRDRSDESFIDLVTPLLNGKRPWATCSLVWKRKFITNWTSLRTNQDYLFEFQNALINNKIKHIPEILSVINKNTGQNSVDLVSNKSILSNKNIVLCYAFQNIVNYCNLNLSKIETYQLAINGLKIQIIKSIELFSYKELKRILKTISIQFEIENIFILYLTLFITEKRLRIKIVKFLLNNIIQFQKK